MMAGEIKSTDSSRVSAGPTVVIYGSYGYTGSLIAKIASESGHRVLLSGRDRNRLSEQAAGLGLEYLPADIDHPDELDSLLAGASVVIHCAGPFIHTWKQMAEACLRNGCHYIDITGEIEVFEEMKRLDNRFAEAGLMALPGAGFDVVPSDCLALHLKEQLPDADWLEIGFRIIGSSVSKGTATSMVMRAGMGGALRSDGQIRHIATAQKTRYIDFGRGPVTAMSLPWGDVSTAYTTTGIPNITAYIAMKKSTIRLMKLSNIINPLLRTSLVRNLMKKLIKRRPAGPDAGQLKNGRCIFWGEVKNASGKRVEARLVTPEAYKLTSESTWLIAEKILGGDFKPGYQTPAGAYGKGLAGEIDGCRWISI